MITLVIIGILIVIATMFGMGHTGNPMRGVNWLPFIERFGLFSWIAVAFYLFGKKLGGLLWFISIVVGFYLFGWKFGVTYLLGTFVVGALADSLLVKPFFRRLSKFL